MPWRQVGVGDLLRVCRDEPLPADLVLLASSNSEGSCYVETTNLDGETNLKIKSTPEETRGLAPGDLCHLVATIECEPPNSRLYTFTGNLRIVPPLPPSLAARVATAAASGSIGGAYSAAAAAAVAAAEAASTMLPALRSASMTSDVARLGPAYAATAVKMLHELRGSLQMFWRKAQGEGESDAVAENDDVAGEAVPVVELEGEEASQGDRANRILEMSSASVAAASGLIIPLSATSLLLRGCSIRNTECVYGTVVYAGTAGA